MVVEDEWAVADDLRLILQSLRHSAFRRGGDSKGRKE